MPSPILARADALMQRRRQGETGPFDDVPVLTDTVEIDDDHPVLIDSIDAAPPANLPPALDSEQLDSIAQQLASRIKAHIAAELPALIEASVRDFLAEREKLTQKSAPD